MGQLKFQRHIAVIAAGATLLVGTGYGAFSLIDWLKHRPQRLTTYMGISLNEAKPVIIYKKGTPSYVEDDPPANPTSEYNPFMHIYSVSPPDGEKGGIPPGKQQPDYNLWAYDYANGNTNLKGIDVGFDPNSGKVDKIECFADGPNVKFCDLPFGIGIDTTEQAMKDRLGTPEYENIRNGTKTVFYKRFNLRFELRKERIVNITVTISQRDTHALLP